MTDPSVRSTSHDRTERSVGVLLRPLAFALVLMVLPAALAQGPVDPACPPTAYCHPGGSGMSAMEDAASAVGSELVRRRESGDCTGIGPEGCLGVMLSQLMCLIDGRDWVQQYACASGPVETPPAGGGGGGGGGGATPPAETPAPPAGGEPAPKPEPEPEALVAVSATGIGRWLRAELDRTNAGERLAQVRIGEHATLDLIVWGRYERRRADPNRFFAVLRAIDSIDRRERFIVVGVAGDLIYVGDVERLRERARRGGAPAPFEGALALGGPR